MELLKKWENKYSELNSEYLQTKEMMTEREIYEVKSHLKSISSFIEDIQALRQPPVGGQLPPNAITDKEHKDLMKVLYPKDNSKRFRR